MKRRSFLRSLAAIAGAMTISPVATLPQFVPRNNRVHKKVFVDPHYPTNEWMIGFKGDQFLLTGHVLAEYQKL